MQQKKTDATDMRTSNQPYPALTVSLVTY